MKLDHLVQLLIFMSVWGMAGARLVGRVWPWIPLAGRMVGALQLVGAGGGVVMVGCRGLGSCSRRG
jgi:hypothetical protein